MHGFFTERCKGNLNDFLAAKIERNFLNDELGLTLVGALEAMDVGNIKDSYGIVLFSELNYRPVDNLELTFGVYFFGGKGGSLFGHLKESDQMTLKAEYSF